MSNMDLEGIKNFLGFLSIICDPVGEWLSWTSCPTSLIAPDDHFLDSLWAAVLRGFFHGRQNQVRHVVFCALYQDSFLAKTLWSDKHLGGLLQEALALQVTLLRHSCMPILEDFRMTHSQDALAIVRCCCGTLVQDMVATLLPCERGTNN